MLAIMSGDSRSVIRDDVFDGWALSFQGCIRAPHGNRDAVALRRGAASICKEIQEHLLQSVAIAGNKG
jgi:hypothetical protein